MTTYLVTGAAGQLGRRAISLLLERDLHVIATTRDPAKLADLAGRGVDVRRADFDDAASLAAAFAGADRALLISTDTIERPGHRIAQHRAAVAALAAAGVKHVVYTSMPNAPKSVCLIAPDHAATEAALAATALDYTILRNAIYMEMLLHSLPAALASGTLVDSKGAARIAYVAREDCARAAVGALIGGRGRQTFDVTGPAAVTSDELVALVGAVAKRPLAHVSVSHAALVDGMVAHGFTKELAEMYASFDLAAVNGDLAAVTTTVRDLGGAAPTTLDAFLAAHFAK